MENQKKIIWSVDIYEKDATIQKSGLKLLAKWAAANKAVIEPVFVLSPLSLRLGIDRSVKVDVANFQKPAEQLMQEFINSCENVELARGKILLCQEYSIKENVRTLLSYAQSPQVLTIAAATHARSGIKRFWLGSFVETLLLQSRLPLLTYNPQTGPSDKLKDIMLPTTFSEEDEGMFDKVLEQCRNFSAQLSLYYIIPDVESAYPIGAHYFSPEIHNQIYENVQKEEGRAEDIAGRWVAKAEASGVKARYVISKEYGNTAELIVRFAERESIDLIATASHAKGVEAALFGSTGRQIIRYAHCPVWAIHSEW